MKKYVVFAIFLLLLNNLSAIIITEVESNPADGKTGKEWIEIYNDERGRVDLSGWSIYDGLASEKKRYTFPREIEIKPGEFYIVEFESPVLNNEDDFVILRNDNGKDVDKTDKIKEVSASTKTWQVCNGDWIFAEQTREEENECDSEKEENIDYMELNETEIIEIENEILGINTPKTYDAISLGTKTIKSDEDKKDLPKGLAIYGLISFGILISLLLFFRNKKYKTEFK